jgi:diamine N-acetyltransferase
MPSDTALVLEMMQEYYVFDRHAFDEPKARTALENFLNNPTFGQAWLICEDATPVGYAVLTFGYSLELLGRDAFIDELYLREKYRGRGWGRRALEFIEEQARIFGVRAIHLEVVRDNVTAREIYRKSGFRDRGHFLMSKWIEKSFAKPGETEH